MAQLDPIVSALVATIRNLSDHELLGLVRVHIDRLGTGRASAPAAPRPAAPAARKARKARKAAPKAAAPAKKAAPAKRKAGGKRTKITNEAKAALSSKVESAVKGSSGLSASEIAKAVGAPQARVATVVKELKTAKRIFQGGDRRFARYAGDARTAESASLNARKNASSAPPKKKK